MFLYFLIGKLMRKFNANHFITQVNNKANSTCRQKMVVVSSSIKTANRKAVYLKKFTNSRKMMVVRNNIKLANKGVVLRKFGNSTYRKMVLVRETKLLKKKEALQRVLYALYCAEVGGQRFYYPEQFDVSVDVTRASIEMSQQYYSFYMPIYMSRSIKELDLIPRNTPEYYNYALEHIQPFGGLNYPQFVTPDFAEVMFDDRFNILRSPGFNPLDLQGSEMVNLLTQYRLEFDPNYMVTRELLNHIPDAMLRDSDFALCAFILAGGFLSDFVAFEPADALLVWSKALTFSSYLVKTGYLVAAPVLVAADAVANAVIPAADAVIPAADAVISAADAVMPAADAVPFPTVELDTADTGPNNTDPNNTDNTDNTGSPKPGFPFYSCIFGVLLVGVLIKTIFF